MKTKLISTLKKDLLLVELPEEKTISTLIDLEITYGYTLLGKPDEIKEEDVKDLVRSGSYTTTFWNHKTNDNHKSNQLRTALESFNSALESEIYWNVNPLSKDKPSFDPFLNYGQNEYWVGLKNKWNEAQEKTFDKNRTLIFVKN